MKTTCVICFHVDEDVVIAWDQLGKRNSSENNGYGQNEFVSWQINTIT